MPFLNEFFFIHIAYLHSLFDLLFFKTMIINKLYIGTQFDFGFFAISFYMDMYRLMLVQIEKESQSKYNQ